MSSLTSYCSKLLEFFIIIFSFSLSHSFLCRASLYCFPLSFSFSFSIPLCLSLTLDLHFNNGEQHNDKDGAIVAVFLRASSKVLWMCSFVKGVVDVFLVLCWTWDAPGVAVFCWVDRGLLVMGVGWFCGVGWFVGVGLICWDGLICGCWVDSVVWVDLWMLNWFVGVG